jgi:hypothetical protein
MDTIAMVPPAGPGSGSALTSVDAVVVLAADPVVPPADGVRGARIEAGIA